MLVTSRTWRFTRWMPVAWWRPLQAEAPAGEQRPGRPMLLQATLPRGRLRSVRTFSSRPTRRWPCLIRSGRVGVEVAPVAVAAAGAEALVEVAPVAVAPGVEAAGGKAGPAGGRGGGGGRGAAGGEGRRAAG